ncbi:4-hydroxy-tetrahydrodipicolinate reductase [Thermodesulforhabdus norvegica]|uniref:4-hydroxy-tetrahydrodipicolinate reductase n=1 Tax=Thermodesulforhabdus norvegica TaxID=39841 RepID=A0A1I4W685_9BACT|nr:4-hydroxy-tetrahydrodipicolinate reductase [Thermodesulforhabdus norvegica]SFN08569.1 dihydrodipicolinate reductase [Thermodesulforhabdus norvegica]
MIRVAVAGIAGRMGSRIAQLVSEAEDLTLVGCWERKDHPLVGKPLKSAVAWAPEGLMVSESPEKAVENAEVVIDFTVPEATVEHAKICASMGICAVIGTTGLSETDRKILEECARKIPMVVAPNMSVGVNVLFRLVEFAARLLGPDFDIEIVEAHHRFKKDAPSGTAIKLGQILADATGRSWDNSAVYVRKGIVGERKPEEIGIQVLRAGDIVGEHTVLFASLGERIEITHRAHSRDNFARGALRAARWVVGKAPGLYDMQNVLGLV